MRQILLLGAGKSSAYLIQYLLNKANDENLFLTVACLTVNEAIAKTNQHPRSKAIAWTLSDAATTNLLVAASDLVISMLPAHLHIQIAHACLLHTKNLITASYISDEIKQLHDQVVAKDLIFLNEMGLDPGIDHLSAMQLINDIHEKTGTITSFESYCGGLIAPECDTNAWQYKFTWNPRNVIVAGQGSPAKHLKDGKLKYTPYSLLFKQSKKITIDGLGFFDGYTNRDSLKYQEVYGLKNTQTLLRGTLRRYGFCTAWDIFVQLGLTDDSYTIENTDQLSPNNFINLFLPEENTTDLNTRIETAIGRNLSEDEIKKLNELNFNDNQTNFPFKNASPAQLLEHILTQKWQLLATDKDMIVMHHKISYLINDTLKTKQAQLIVFGENATYTAMAKTVGLPLAIGALLILNKKIKKYGVQLPLYKEIYTPVLNELATYGIVFTETEL